MYYLKGDNMRPYILVLFDGLGLAAEGFRREGFHTVGVELNPEAHALARVLLDHNGRNRGTLINENVLNIHKHVLTNCLAIWCSPPCQTHSAARTQGAPLGDYSTDFMDWSHDLLQQFPDKPIYIENVTRYGKELNKWGTLYNAAQFGTNQNRNRIVGGRYPEPISTHPYKKWYTLKGHPVCPAVTATEYKGCASDTRRASRFYKGKLSLSEMAYHMDLIDHPDDMDLINKFLVARPISSYTPAMWKHEVCRAIGNGVPVRMAQAFAKSFRACNYSI